MKISHLLADETVLAEIGRRIAARRIELDLTQADLAEQAGIAKRTLERMEAGHSSQLLSLVRVLRELGSLPALNALLPESEPRPMDLLKREGKVRQRVRSKRGRHPSNKPWQWDDTP